MKTKLTDLKRQRWERMIEAMVFILATSTGLMMIHEAIIELGRH